MDRCLTLWHGLDISYRSVSDGLGGGMMRVDAVAIRDEVPDGEFVAGWNAYVEGLYPAPADSPEFFEGWVKAYKEYNNGQWPALREYNPED